MRIKNDPRQTLDCFYICQLSGKPPSSDACGVLHEILINEDPLRVNGVGLGGLFACGNF